MGGLRVILINQARHLINGLGSDPVGRPMIVTVPIGPY
jgi:hypothetical protein